MISFGPIPSRRLGKSLGINNIPSRKVCSYSCVYCQVGITKKYLVIRENFYEPHIIYKEVQSHLNKLSKDDKPDYLTFVSNGEPTLDINLGKSITLLRKIKIPLAIITNATMLNYSDVRNALKKLDWVSLKIDTAEEQIWKTINRPCESLDFENHLMNLFKFTKEFKGKLVTETMLVNGYNDSSESLRKTADLISKINPSIAYISVPTRPPAVFDTVAPNESVINNAYQIFSGKGINTELILGFEGCNTGFTGNILEDIINICSVHPIREDTMKRLLKKDNADDTVLNMLLDRNYIQKIKYKSKNFYIRKFHI